jgi:hemolysin activation/secretion protein
MRKITFFLAIIILLPLNAVAQNLPPGQEPEAAASRFQNEAERKKAFLQTKEVKAPEIEYEKEKPAAPVPSGVSFALKDVKITGSTLFKPEDFLPLYKKYIDKEITFDEVNEIVDNVKAKYKERGFLTTSVYIPEQQILGGVIEIRVAEGKMGRLLIEGNKWFTKNIFGKYIHAKKNEILNIKTLQMDLLRLNQNPDLEVRTVIAAGQEPQTSDITLKVKDNFPYHLGTGADNQGTRFSGDYRASAFGRSTNFTSNNDFLFFNSVASADSSGDFMTYVTPIDTMGTKFGFDFSYFTSKIGREFRDYDIVGNTWTYTPHISGEIYLSEAMQIYTDAGLKIQSTKKFQGSDLTVNEQLRVPYYSITYSRIDSFFGGGQTTFTPEISFSIGGNFLGASSGNNPKASRVGTCGYYFKYIHTLRRIQRMPWESYVLVRHQFQGVSHTLPSSEQLQLGGESTVRGYPEGDYLADIGATLNVDWVFPLYLIPRDYKLPFDETPLRNEIQPFIFTDIGGGGLKKKLTGERWDKFLMGVGGGLRLNFYNKFNARVEWAQAIGADPTQNSGPSTFHLVVNFEI